MSRSFWILLLLSTAALAPGCEGLKGTSSKKKETPAEPPRPAPKAGIDLGDARVAAAARVVRRSCSLSELGDVSSCVGQVVEELDQAEKRVGTVPSLLTYCHAIDDADLGVKVLAANRTGQLSQHAAIRESADDKLLGCYLEKISRVRNVYLAQHYVRAATFLATALKQEERLFSMLEKMPAPPDHQRTAHECLWPNGRMRVLPRLKKAIASKEASMRKAALLSFAYVKGLEDGEKEPVCALISPLLGDAEVAIDAAQRLAALCPERRKAVLAVAGKALAAKKLGLGHVEALRAIAVAGGKEQKASVALLAGAVGQRSLPEITRRAALRALTSVDPRQGERLQKKLDAERPTKKT
jgi:hypothetical protein